MMPELVGGLVSGRDRKQMLTSRQEFSHNCNDVGVLVRIVVDH